MTTSKDVDLYLDSCRDGVTVSGSVTVSFDLADILKQMEPTALPDVAVAVVGYLRQVTAGSCRAVAASLVRDCEDALAKLRGEFE